MNATGAAEVGSEPDAKRSEWNDLEPDAKYSATDGWGAKHSATDGWAHCGWDAKHSAPGCGGWDESLVWKHSAAHCDDHPEDPRGNRGDPERRPAGTKRVS